MADTPEGRPSRRPPLSYEQQCLLNVLRLRQRRETEREADGDGALWAPDDGGVTLDGAAADEFHDRFAR